MEILSLLYSSLFKTITTTLLHHVNVYYNYLKSLDYAQHYSLYKVRLCDFNKYLLGVVHNYVYNRSTFYNNNRSTFLSENVVVQVICIIKFVYPCRLLSSSLSIQSLILCQLIFKYCNICTWWFNKICIPGLARERGYIWLRPPKKGAERTPPGKFLAPTEV